MKVLALALTTLALTASPAGAQQLAAVGQVLPSTPPPAAGTPAPAPEPFARWNRFAFNFGFGFGSASLSRFHDMGGDFMGKAGISADDAPQSGLQINAEVAFRYYFPYYVMAQVGFDTVYNKASSDVNIGIGQVSIHSDTLVMETPILIGGYYTFIDRLYVFGAAGPSVFFFPRSWWDIEPGSASDLKADPGVGFHFLAGADFLVAEHFAAGLELRYRYLKTGDLKELDSGTAIHPFLGSTEPYDLDFSGISLGIVLRFYII
jgi:opacity protein-like surface antigen